MVIRSHFGSSPPSFVAPPQSPPTTHCKLGFGTCNARGLLTLSLFRGLVRPFALFKGSSGSLLFAFSCVYF